MPPLPALQVRVPNAANALLQAEQILGAREQRNALLRQQEQSANLGQLLSSDLSDPTVRQQVQRKAFAIDPNTGLQVQQMFRGMSEAERVEAERDASTIARTFFNVNSPASFASARNRLPPGLRDQIPETFDPNLVRGLVDVATPLSEMFANERTRMQTESRERIASAPTPAVPRTDLGRISADLANGFVTPAQALRQAQQSLAPTEQWRPVTAEERLSFGIPEGQAAQISTTGKVSTIGGGGGITLFDPQTGNVIAQVGGSALTPSQRGSQAIDIADEVRQTGVRLSELSTSLASLRANPQAAGLSGLAIEKLGGVTQQISNLVGVDGDWVGTAPVQQTRTELASLLGQYIPTITGDDSGRYSDQDARRADAALPARSPTASFQQVQAALLTLQDVERRARGRALMRLDGFDPRIDITYPAGRSSYAQQLMSQGSTPEQAADAIIDLLDKYEIPLTVEGIQ
ncbi:MAG: hypothetical protein ACR2RF_05935 [Geminicoccaceae bacterium]